MKKLLLTALVLIVILPLTTSAENLPSFPMSFWGNTTINDSSSPIGVIIRAYYGSELAGQITIQESGIYGYSNPTKQKLVVKEGVGEIRFTIQHNDFNSGLETEGNDLQSYPSFESASAINKDFSFFIASSQSTTNTGGGGGVYIPSTNNSTNDVKSKADSNKDGKVDIMDFNSLMVNWGSSTNNTADFNDDGVVDIFDFNLLMINWTK